MTQQPYEASWSRTRAHLQRAAEVLGAPESELSQYFEWLKYNELELAMDELADRAHGNGAKDKVWQHLADAATEMELNEQARDFRRMLEP